MAAGDLLRHFGRVKIWKLDADETIESLIAACRGDARRDRRMPIRRLAAVDRGPPAEWDRPGVQFSRARPKAARGTGFVCRLPRPGPRIRPRIPRVRKRADAQVFGDARNASVAVGEASEAARHLLGREKALRPRWARVVVDHVDLRGRTLDPALSTWGRGCAQPRPSQCDQAASDKLAEELVRVYPLIAEQLAELPARARVQLADAGIRPRPPGAAAAAAFKGIGCGEGGRPDAKSLFAKRGAWASEAEID